MDNTILNTTQNYAYYQYDSDVYSYLSSNMCYWTNSLYDSNNAFAVYNNNLYGELKSTTCKVVPIIVANKIDLE